MQQFIEFFIHHWFLCSLLIVLVVLLIVEESRAQGLGRFGVAPKALVILMNRENPFILDIRDSNSFKDGHILGSTNIPQGSLDQDMKKIDKHKSKPVIVVDANGQKSVAVANKLRKLGFENVKVLTGGIAGWKNAELPVTKK